MTTAFELTTTEAKADLNTFDWSRTTALELTTDEATGGLNTFDRCQILALGSAKKYLACLLSYAMHQHMDAI